MRNHLSATILVLLAGCLDTAPLRERDSAQLDLNIVRNLYDDMRRIDTGDLIWGTGRIFTDGVNDLLDEIPYSDIALEPTELYGLEERARDDLTVHDLAELSTSITARFGEKSLPAIVNRVRANHLQGGGEDRLFAESAFRLGLDLGDAMEWKQAVPGLGLDGDGSVRLGFDLGASTEARVVSAYPDEGAAIVHSPLEAIKALRGFVLPRNLEDLGRMKPGESVTLHGDGHFGFNFGVGVPLLAQTVIDSVTYTIVASGALRVVAHGSLDVQFVRMEGNRAIVDVGLSQAEIVTAYLAIKDGWGVRGLFESEVDIAGIQIDIGSLLDKALQSKLRQQLDLVSARLQYSSRTVPRESVMRFGIDLDRAGNTDLVNIALEQLRFGDLRLAQALAHNGTPGITEELDLYRAGRTTSGHLGFGLLGMKFFREARETQGEASVATPDGALSVMFGSDQHWRGGFFSAHGYTLAALSGVEVALPQGIATGRGGRGQTNLYFGWQEGDDYMERDKLRDQIDGVLLAVLGAEGQARVSAALDELARATQAACEPLDTSRGIDSHDARAVRARREALDRCRMDVLDSDETAAKRVAAESTFAQALGSSAAGDRARQLASQAFVLALAECRAYEHRAAMVGPPTNVAQSTWLSDATLQGLFANHTGADLRRAVETVQAILDADRSRSDGLEQARRVLQEEDRDALYTLSGRFDDGGERYDDLQRLSMAQIDRVGQVGDDALLITLPVDGSHQVLYDSVTSRTIARARADAALGLFGALVDDLRAIDSRPERTLGVALLTLLPPSGRTLRLDVDMDVDREGNLEGNWTQDFDHYRAAGVREVHAATRGADVDLLGDVIGWDIARIVRLE